MVKHYSVLLSESIEGLNIKEDGIYIDATLGYGGHSSEILKKIPKGHLYSFDQDKEAIEFSNNRLSKIGNNFTIIHSNFVNMVEELEKLNINKVDGILFDLGLSSPQIDEKERGFSFMSDSPLDMRMNREDKTTAKDIINKYSYDELLNIFYSYGEEKMSKQIAKKIISKRENKEINTTKELVDIIKNAVGAKYFNNSHPERNIFQAIRIEVNNELNTLRTILPKAIKILNTGGRISVITFHSLEDRIVKQAFKKASDVNELVKGLPEIPSEYKPLIKLINKKPIIPSSKELEENTRSKSAKLRIIERL